MPVRKSPPTMSNTGSGQQYEDDSEIFLIWFKSAGLGVGEAPAW